MQCRTPNAHGPITLTSTPLGRGGEGSVFAVSSHQVRGLPPASELVAKVYHDPAAGEREAKVQAMLAAVPDSDAVAWPLGAVYDDAGAFKGYVMVKLAMDKYKSWAQLSHAGDRRRVLPEFDVRYGLTAARNLAAALDSIHNAGHMVGDVNESNILIADDAQVMIVDTDSAQVSAAGRVFPCLVGKPEYTAPEISHGALKDHRRTLATDMYAYCVALFQMLTGGAHPTNAVYDGDGDPKTTVEKIRAGIYPGLVDTPREYQPVPRIPVKALPGNTRKILQRGLAVDPARRPSMPAVIKALDSLLSHLTQCSTEPNHWFDEREKPCPWCRHAKRQPDPWAKEAKPVKSANVKQTALPALTFKDAEQAPTAARRAPVVTRSNPARTSAAPRVGSMSPGMSAQAPVSMMNGLPAASVPSTGSTGTSSPSGLSGAQNGTQGRTAAKPMGPYEKPVKIKGKVAVRSPMGGYIQRPALSRMGLAQGTKAFLLELPEALQFIWPNYRAKPSVWGLLLGLLAGLAASCTWLWGVPELASWMNLEDSSWAAEYIPMFTLLAVGIGALFTVILTGSGFIRHLSWRKRFAHLGTMSVWRTAFYAVPMMLYGLLAPVGLVLAAVVFVLNSIINSSGRR